jgi:UDP-N-acetylglucosamine/UDP-N-acetylgalactosamine diphosphorylase
MQRQEINCGYDPRISALLDKGVVVYSPSSVFLDPDVQPERIAAGAVIHPGCRLRGAKLSIGPGSVLGEEAPATVDDCQLGRNVCLKGGYFAGSTFLDGCSVGSSAHVRPGTLLEEGASAAHSVGLKQTILLPYVTIGSLVNFCDCLMAGGTGARDHGEVGSSYIHFNYTPSQDKATASLLGDVPRGVMLDMPPIFLGGQGGMVGPSRIAFGTVIAAGVICRDDVLEEGLLYTGRPTSSGRSIRIRSSVRVGLDRSFRNNLHYLGNIRALRVWYQEVRVGLSEGDVWSDACRVGALVRLDMILEERMRRLRELADSLGGAEVYNRLSEAWPRLHEDMLRPAQSEVAAHDRNTFLSAWQSVPAGTPYPQAIASLDREVRTAGTRWLQSLVDQVVGLLPDKRQSPAREES